MNSGQVDVVTSSPALPDLVFLRLLATSELGGRWCDLCRLLLSCVCACMHMYLLYVRYAISFIGNLTVVLVAHVLPCSGIWAVLVGF